MSPKAINQRLIAIEDLESYFDVRNDFLTKMSKLPDLERIKNRMLNSAIRQDKKIYLIYGQHHIIRMKE